MKTTWDRSTCRGTWDRKRRGRVCHCHDDSAPIPQGLIDRGFCSWCGCTVTEVPDPCATLADILATAAQAEAEAGHPKTAAYLAARADLVRSLA